MTNAIAKNYPDFIENSFRVCGITTNDPGKVRNDEFFKKIMNSVKGKLADEGEELLEDGDTFSYVQYPNNIIILRSNT